MLSVFLLHLSLNSGIELLTGSRVSSIPVSKKLLGPVTGRTERSPCSMIVVLNCRLGCFRERTEKEKKKEKV